MKYGTFVVADPRTFDGDPYEVAGRAVAQAGALTALLKRAVTDARVMARNSELERQPLDEMDVSLFEEGIHGKKFDTILETLERLQREFRALEAAAKFDPKRQ